MIAALRTADPAPMSDAALARAERQIDTAFRWAALRYGFSMAVSELQEWSQGELDELVERFERWGTTDARR